MSDDLITAYLAGHFDGTAVGRAAARAITRAGGDALRAMRAEGVRKVRERKVIKAATLRDPKIIAMIFPTDHQGDAKSAAQQWRLRVTGAPTPVLSYGARQIRVGVSAAINAGGRAVIRHAFIAKMKSGHEGVFIRYGQAFRQAAQRYRGHKRYAGEKRQPIRELYTTRVLDVFTDSDMAPAVLGRGEEVFRRTFERNVQAALEQVRAITR